MEEKDKKLDTTEEVETEQEEVELELSPNRGRIFLLGWIYILSLIILGGPVFLLHKALLKSLNVKASVLLTALISAVVTFPGFFIWKKTRKEVEKNEDYGYDGKLKFSFYSGLVGTTASVTLIFITIFVGFVWLITPSALGQKIGYINGESVSIRDFRNRMINENPTIRPKSVVKMFGEIDFENFKKIRQSSSLIKSMTLAEIEKEYKEKFKTSSEPNKRLIKREFKRYLIRYALYLSAKQHAKKKQIFQALLNFGNKFDLYGQVGSFMEYKKIDDRALKYKAVPADLSMVSDIAKYRQEITFNRMIILKRNHQNNERKAFAQAMKAYKALTGGMKWKAAFIKYDQYPRRSGARNVNEMYKKAHTENGTTDYLKPFFTKPANFITKPIKLPFGYMILRILKTKKLTDQELLKNELVKYKIQQKKREEFHNELEKLLNSKFRKEIKLNINALFGNRESRENFITASNEIYIPAFFFWKELSEVQKYEFSLPANRQKLNKYIEKKYVKPIMLYLLFKHEGRTLDKYLKTRVRALEYQRFIMNYVYNYLMPKFVTPEFKRAGIQGLKAYYAANARRFTPQARTRFMGRRRRPTTPPKKWHQLDALMKKKVEISYKNYLGQRILKSYIEKTLFKKYKISLYKKYFKMRRRRPRYPARRFNR